MPISTNANGLTTTRVVSDGHAVGYEAGVGGAVTQITSRATGVTLNKVCGAITTDTTSLAAEASAKFTVTNSFATENSVINLSFRDAVALNTNVIVTDTADGSFELTVVNGNVAAGTAETGAIIINFEIKHIAIA